jgi:hypothetical protein
LISRRSTLAVCATLAALVAGAAISAYAIEYNEHRLAARIDGDLLRVSAPNFSFLNGKSLERLKDGASVAFIAQLTVSESRNWVIPDAATVAHFAVSYDIWEERFSVALFSESKPGDRPEQKRMISHLSGPAAEAWCFDKLAVSLAALPANRPFYLQLDLRVQDPGDQAGVIGETGISIARMVEIFSRPVREKQIHWLLDGGPLRLDDLRRGMHG